MRLSLSRLPCSSLHLSELTCLYPFALATAAAILECSLCTAAATSAPSSCFLDARSWTRQQGDYLTQCAVLYSPAATRTLAHTQTPQRRPAQLAKWPIVPPSLTRQPLHLHELGCTVACRGCALKRLGSLFLHPAWTMSEGSRAKSGAGVREAKSKPASKPSPPTSAYQIVLMPRPLSSEIRSR